jgi:hypothetical protein
MNTWSTDELALIGGADELQVASRRPDGTLRPYVTIWMVRVEGEVYIRSAYGPQNGWYRRASASGEGRVRFGGVERDVTFTAPKARVQAAIDDAYHAKYDKYGARMVGTVVSDDAHQSTLRLEPVEPVE